MHSHLNACKRTRQRVTAISWLIVAGLVICVIIATSADGAWWQQDKPIGEVASCATGACHSDIANHKVMHTPVLERKCLDCHQYISPEDHLFQLTAPKTDLCKQCHKTENASVIHTPVAQNDCTSCHNPHGSEFPNILTHDPLGNLCVRCHEVEYSKKSQVHGPVAVGACIVCHEAHSSDRPHLLSMPTRDLCLECHSGFEHDNEIGRQIHKPMEDGCTSCHDPHATDFKYQLQDDVPNLCFSCHEGMEQLIKSSPVAHGPAMDPYGCTECHTPHSSRLPKLQKEEQPELCLSCHDKPIEATDGRMLTNMAALLEENPNHHGPIREGSCTFCHQPHATDHNRLLLESYPPEFYAPFKMEKYELCFGCHMPELATEKNGRGVTRFRNGDQNLHFLHVNQEKGRTCRACHEVHASKKPFHIRDAVPFGSKGWMLQINFKQLDTGGSCAPACHQEKTYNRDALTPVLTP